jgi:carbamoyl-phosphate synthase small subunit
MKNSGKTATLILEDGTTFTGTSFGWSGSVAGEVVFNTGMVGYPESMTDPSYKGQILAMTYPLVGNYGIPKSCEIDRLETRFESNRIQISGLLVSEYSRSHSHWNSAQSLSDWLKSQKIPAISGIDTRTLTKRLRHSGTMLGKIEFEEEKIDFYDPNLENLVAQVSSEKVIEYGHGPQKVVLIDCGCKNSIISSLTSRGVTVKRVPWDFDFLDEDYDGMMISNGPGNPKMCRKTILNVRKAFQLKKPVFGICLGNQILALAAGGNTYKLKFGHRSQNQPCVEVGTNRCYITSQNHGFAVDNSTLPEDWVPWFVNANDGSCEGIRHNSLPFMSVQFHPEAAPGPVDTAYLFDRFINML